MCFPLAWIAQICIWAIVIGAVFAILQLVVPYAMSKAGVAAGEGINLVIRVLKIVLWAVIAILVVVICFDLIACLLGTTLSLPRLGR